MSRPVQQVRIVTSEQLAQGYQVFDPSTGQIMRRDYQVVEQWPDGTYLVVEPGTSPVAYLGPHVTVIRGQE